MVTDPIKFVYLVGDGVTTDFSYAYNGTVGFDADVADDVKAAILNPDGTRDINPNFAVMQDTYGNFIGKIRFAVAPVANAIIYIYRATPQTQETEYKTSSGFDAQNVENDFDKLTKLVQETSSHARNKTLQLDMFQEVVLKLVLTSATNQNQMMYVDWATHTIRFTPFTKGQTVITPAAGQDDKTDIMLTHLTDEGTGLPYLAFSLDQGATWKPMNFAEISAIVNSANAKAKEALDNSENAVGVANAAKAVADGIDAKAQEALDNSETAVSTANDAKAVADGIDAKAQEALDNSETAVSVANAAKAVADGIDAKAQEALDNSETNALEIKGLQGAGGALTATNLGSNPTQQSITEYAIDQIWPNNTNFTWDASNPAASTFTDANGVARTAAEIFNSTWVNNTYDDHRWQLTNTQNTTPKVFEWADVGRDIVSVATATTAGIVRVGSGSQMVVNPTTGDISLNGAKAASIRSTIDAPGLSAENEYADNAIYSLQKGIILQGANGEKYTIRTDGSNPSGFIIYEGESSANIILSFQPSDQNTITIGNGSYRVKAGSSGPLTSNDKTVATTEWVRDIIAEQMGGDFVQYWDSGDATDHSHAKPGVSTPASGTWYRLYKSGWVEQGITYPTDSTGTGGSNDFAFTFPIPMKSAAYTIGAGGPLTINNLAARVVAKNTTGITAYSQERTVRCSNIVVFGWAA